jgi:hypothetical protein
MNMGGSGQSTGKGSKPLRAGDGAFKSIGFFGRSIVEAWHFGSVLYLGETGAK